MMNENLNARFMWRLGDNFRNNLTDNFANIFENGIIWIRHDLWNNFDTSINSMGISLESYLEDNLNDDK